MPWALSNLELGKNVLELGPGPGLTTEILRNQVASLTSVEIDARLAQSLKLRSSANNIIIGDATCLPFAEASFSAVVSFTMLHHIPSTQLQDRLIAEAYRVLRPGGVFAGTDSTSSLLFRLAHAGDTMIVVDANTFERRLKSAGFCNSSIKIARSAFSFRATRPG